MTAHQPLPPYLPPLLFLAIGPLWWMIVCWIISRAGGWSYLAEYYPATRPIEGKLLRLRSLSTTRLCNYRGAVNLGVAPDGLYLSLMFFFRVGHPTLFIPWEEITAKPVKKMLVFDLIELSFQKAPGVKLLLRPVLYDEITSSR